MESDVSSAKYMRHLESFLEATEIARTQSENCRDYYDHKQWTEEEINILKRRKQAPIVVNRIKPKVDALKGLVVNQRTDPKAFPRTRKHEDAAYAITDGLRYVNDNADFDQTEERVAENFFIEGYGACIVEIKQTPSGVEIMPRWIPWDRYYFDYHSREHDFSDKKYDGIVLWMDIEDAVELFPEHDEDLRNLCQSSGSGSETFDDRPMWVSRDRKRLKICQEYCIEDGVWQEVFYAYQITLQKGPSPYLDEDGEPTNPIESVCAYIDRDLNRYGPVHTWLDLQDEVNHRRSKALHLMSVRQTSSRQGAITDIDEMKRELAKPDGHVEYVGEKGDFDTLATGDMATAQFELLQEAKAELDSISVNAQLSGERQQGDLSGRAITALQAGGMLELNPLLADLQRWKRRVFRQVWYRIKQFWTEEKWIRVTDDYDTLKWVGLNYQVTAGEILQEKAEDESLPPEQREQAAMLLQMASQRQDPRLRQVVEVRNQVADLDVDIILDVSPDSLTIQDEQFQILVQLASSRPEVPFASILKMSRLRDKDSIIDDMEEAAEANAQMQAMLQQLNMAKQQKEMEYTEAQTIDKMAQAQQRGADVNIKGINTQADVSKKQAETTQKELENLLLVTDPGRVTSVAI